MVPKDDYSGLCVLKNVLNKFAYVSAYDFYTLLFKQNHGDSVGIILPFRGVGRRPPPTEIRYCRWYCEFLWGIRGESVVAGTDNCPRSNDGSYDGNRLLWA